MVGNAGFAHKKLTECKQGFFTEALEVTVNLVVTKGDGKGVKLLFLRRGTGEFADEGKLLIGAECVSVQWGFLLSVREFAVSVRHSSCFLQFH